MRPLRIALLIMLVGCGSETIVEPPPEGGLRVFPTRALLHPGDTLQLVVDPPASPIEPVVWSVASGPGSIDAGGRYIAPTTVNADTVRVTVEAAVGAARSNAALTIIAGPGGVCYETDVRPVLLMSCAVSGCHDPASRQHGYDFSQDRLVQRAVVPGEPDESAIYLMITHPVVAKRMPPPPREPLSQSQIAAIRQWIVEGAQVRACAVAGEPCDSVEVGYAATVRMTMLSYCTACHEAATADNRGVDLSTYAGVRAVALSGQLLGALTHLPGYAPMPSASEKIAPCEIAQIRQWIIAGAPDN